MNRMHGMLCSAVALLIALAAMAGSATAQEDGYLVVVNAGNSVKSIKADELSRIFLKKVKRWPNGISAVPVDQIRNTRVRAQFTRGVHDRSINAIGSYWQNVIFSGRGVPPVEVASDAEVIAFVRSNPGAVGYVSTRSSTNGVRVLDIR